MQNSGQVRGTSIEALQENAGNRPVSDISSVHNNVTRRLPNQIDHGTGYSINDTSSHDATALLQMTEESNERQAQKSSNFLEPPNPDET